MSVVPKESIEIVAQSIGISNLSPEVALALTPDVEYRVREIMQEAVKCMRHSKRTVLSSVDVDNALKLRNLEPIYGFAACDSLQFKRAVGHKDLFYIDDKDVELNNVIESPLAKATVDTSVVAHWLAVEGVQPAVPENLPTEEPHDGKKSDLKEEELPYDTKPPTKHVISRDLQLYFEKITGLILNKSGSILFREALRSLAVDSGIQPLLPYFTCFIADEVSKNLCNCQLLIALMRMVWCLLRNPQIHMAPYLHQLMPSIITCLVAKQLGKRLSDNHWELRDLAASLVSLICKRFGHVYHNIQPRVTKTLLHVFLDPSKLLPQHYGAVQGLADLGPDVVRQFILPNLEPYMQYLEMEKQKNEMRRHEAWQVYRTLLHAAGKCMHGWLKVFPLSPSPPMRSTLKINTNINGKIVKTISNKRKASSDNSVQQPAPKKMATDSTLGAIPMNSMIVDMQGATTGLPTPLGGSNIGVGRNFPNETRPGREGELGFKGSTALALAWKEDLGAGPLLTSLFPLFGEDLFSFIPKPELSFFL
ncbi:transcription initiation factor TFIID subunit 6-like [Benincasa hispida]|uniref:transcription initiation factor TFIID subunit 6-like n=1 Tax=Benincasa hispida TaxID=102211 RepID=UPI001900080F|nr:transcription initiation factor TFIID subunit 6-like [Benincasa hispida]XP_038902979.1 transcription initiation factor TFIID subunit 6-like [Benincasa hispida]